jgi:choline monooxygenase
MLLDDVGTPLPHLGVPEDSFIDPWIYSSADVYRAELLNVFPRSWVLVADLDDLREPGDYVTDTVGVEPVVLVRARDGELRAFSNVCTHRASTLVEGRGNCGSSLVCPYHGWSFAHDGRLTGVSYRRDFVSPIDPDTLGLRPIPVDTWQRWAFVNLSGDAGPLSAWLEGIPDIVANHGFDTAPRMIERDDEVACNWKVLVDNGACDYHYWFVHAQTLGPSVDPDGLEIETGDTTAVMYARARETAGFHPWSPLVGRARTGSFAYTIFPNLLMLAYPNGSCWVLRWTPTAIDRTRVLVWTYSRDRDEDPRASADLLERIQHEDYTTCERVQVGMRSAGFRPGPRHRLEARVMAFHRRLAAMLAQAGVGSTIEGRGPGGAG